MRTVKRIIKIHEVKDFKISVLFNNGESRVIDFELLLDEWKVKEGDLEYPLRVKEEFQKLELIEGTLAWKNINFYSLDEDGNEVSHPLELDPVVLYENSEKDKSRRINVGLMIKQYRKELGLTQQELASKSGTSKHYISRIENNKTGVELSTLIKIVEGGLGKRIQINIV